MIIASGPSQSSQSIHVHTFIFTILIQFQIKIAGSVLTVFIIFMHHIVLHLQISYHVTKETLISIIHEFIDCN